MKFTKQFIFVLFFSLLYCKLIEHQNMSPFSVTYPQFLNLNKRAIYSIATCQDLYTISLDYYGTYNLINNIDCCNHTGFIPIGNISVPNNYFRGILNGNGYKISNLTINCIYDGCSLISACYNCSIYNFTLHNTQIITQYKYSSLLVAVSYYASIRDINITGDLYTWNKTFQVPLINLLKYNNNNAPYFFQSYITQNANDIIPQYYCGAISSYTINSTFQSISINNIYLYNIKYYGGIAFGYFERSTVRDVYINNTIIYSNNINNDGISGFISVISGGFNISNCFIYENVLIKSQAFGSNGGVFAYIEKVNNNINDILCIDKILFLGIINCKTIYPYSYCSYFIGSTLFDLPGILLHINNIYINPSVNSYIYMFTPLENLTYTQPIIGHINQTQYINYTTNIYANNYYVYNQSLLNISDTNIPQTINNSFLFNITSCNNTIDFIANTFSSYYNEMNCFPIYNNTLNCYYKQFFYCGVCNPNNQINYDYLSTLYYNTFGTTIIDYNNTINILFNYYNFTCYFDSPNYRIIDSNAIPTSIITNIPTLINTNIITHIPTTNNNYIIDSFFYSNNSITITDNFTVIINVNLNTNNNSGLVPFINGCIYFNGSIYININTDTVSFDQSLSANNKVYNLSNSYTSADNISFVFKNLTVNILGYNCSNQYFDTSLIYINYDTNPYILNAQLQYNDNSLSVIFKLSKNRFNKKYIIIIVTITTIVPLLVFIIFILIIAILRCKQSKEMIEYGDKFRNIDNDINKRVNNELDVL